MTLQGGTDGPHRVSIAVNGQSLGVVTFDNQEQKTFAFPVSHASLTTGANSVTFTALGGDDDYSVVASTKLTVQHLLRADGGSFEASLPAGRTARIGGFPSNAIRAMDVTDGPARYYPGGRVKFDDKGRRVGAELLIVQWQNGVPETVFPPSAAVAKPVWPAKQ